MTENDETGAKILAKLAWVQAEIPKAAEKRAKAEERIADLRAQERALTKTLELIGHALPAAAGGAAPTAGGVRGPGIRALDAALKVTEPGEEVTADDVAERVLKAELPLESKNPANAIATAMARAPFAFERVGRGRFRRVQGSDEEAPPPGDERLRGDGASLHGGMANN